MAEIVQTQTAVAERWKTNIWRGSMGYDCGNKLKLLLHSNLFFDSKSATHTSGANP